MTESDDRIMKTILIVFGSLVAIFFISFGFYHNTVIASDVDKTFVDKAGWTINQGAFHKQINCWGETDYFIGDKQIQHNQSWVTMVVASTDSKIVYTKNLQEGVVYSTYEKHYSFLFVPDNYYVIESKDCGKQLK